jgi:hypothetical protein
MTDESDFERPKTKKVGYRNPPEKSRFKTGQSGNPRGRPKGALNLATILERTLREPVIIVENGKRKTVTKIEAAIKELVNQAASGELKALQLLATLVRSAEEREIQAAAPNSSGGGTKIKSSTSWGDEAVAIESFGRAMAAAG